MTWKDVSARIFRIKKSSGPNNPPYSPAKKPALQKESRLFESVVENGFAAAVHSVDVRLCSQLGGSVHGEQRNAHVYHINTKLGNLDSNGSRTALVYLTVLTGLPCNPRPVQKEGYAGHDLRGCVGTSALTAGAGVLGNHNALADVAGVVGFVRLCIAGDRKLYIFPLP